MSKFIVGIDISKAKFDIALLSPDSKIKSKVFQNTNAGFKELIAWLSARANGDLHFCMEATGIYGDALAQYLHDAGYIVSVVNPSQIKGYAQSELVKIKTDKADAKIIARFCSRINPKPWTPKPKHLRELQAMVARLDALQSLEQQEANRLEVANPIVKESIIAVQNKLIEEIKNLKKAIKNHIKEHDDLDSNSKLLESIPGVSERTIAQILAHVGDAQQFESAKHLASFIGVSPKQYCSGSSVKRHTRLSKMGNSRLRKALYMPAIVAMGHNPIIRAFCQNLRLAGKAPMSIIGAAMRKLVHIIYGVLKSKKPFDPSLVLKNA